MYSKYSIPQFWLPKPTWNCQTSQLALTGHFTKHSIQILPCRTDDNPKISQSTMNLKLLINWLKPTKASDKKNLHSPSGMCLWCQADGMSMMPCSQRRAKITKKIAAQFFPKNTTKMTRRQRCEIVWEQIRVFFSSGMKRKNDICQTQKYLLARHGISFQLSHTLMICTFALPFRWLEQAVCCVIARLLVVQRSNFSYLTINI